MFSYTANVYASHQVSVNPGLVYAIIYTVAITLAVVWFLTAVLVRSPRPWTSVLIGFALAVTGVLGDLLLTSAEYGERVFSPAWGVLALLPAVFGAIALVVHLRRLRSPKKSR
ncbi:MAG: hypothetical protein LBU78_07200 [Microbacterium sp.]|jgi:hypothetical protein|nr:hypothetical protein [Microbacterium sp.]